MRFAILSVLAPAAHAINFCDMLLHLELDSSTWERWFVLLRSDINPSQAANLGYLERAQSENMNRHSSCVAMRVTYWSAVSR
jgi:hypothetical protein